jgi:hypothetical protein
VASNQNAEAACYTGEVETGGSYKMCNEDIAFESGGNIFIKQDDGAHYVVEIGSKDKKAEELIKAQYKKVIEQEDAFYLMEAASALFVKKVIAEFGGRSVIWVNPYFQLDMPVGDISSYEKDKGYYILN